MRKHLCPECKIPSFYVKNEQGKILLVYVSDKYEVFPKNSEESTVGFDLSIVYCLGCSWHGSPRKAIKY